MSKNNSLYDFLNSPAFESLQKLETSGAFATARELQNVLESVNPSLISAETAEIEFLKAIAPISDTVNSIYRTYAPIFEQASSFDNLYIKNIISEIKDNAPVISALSELNSSGIANTIDYLPQGDAFNDMMADGFSATVAESLYENGEITQDDINEEITEIIHKKQFSPKAEWDKIKKSKWYLAIRIVVAIITFLFKPVIEYTGDKILDSAGITKFWEESGVYDLIDSILDNAEECDEPETEANTTDREISSIAGRKRENSLNQVEDVHEFLTAIPQDESTRNTPLDE